MAHQSVKRFDELLERCLVLALVELHNGHQYTCLTDIVAKIVTQLAVNKSSGVNVLLSTFPVTARR